MNQRIIDGLVEKIYEAVKSIEDDAPGIAFSGGVDSSTLAVACKRLKRKVTLITIAFPGSSDIDISKEVALKLGLPLRWRSIPLENLEEGIKTVLGIIRFDRLALLENSVCFYYVFEVASEAGIRTVLSANGMDELFCGYDLYRKYYGDEEALMRVMDMLVETARRDKAEMDKIAELWNVNYECPFLSDEFVEYAMSIPSDYKIRDKDDYLRKHALREAALRMGVPESAAMRKKKAFQYSSGIHKAIRSLARRRGYTKERAKKLGYSGGIEAYIESLKSQIESIG